MADFDQLLKDKADQAHYAYKPSAWRGFAKQSGLKSGLSGLSIAAITVGAVVVAGSILWGVLSHNSKPVPAEQVCPPVEMAVALDTVTANEDEALPEIESVTSSHAQTNRPKSNPKTEVHVDTVAGTPQSDPASSKPVAKKTYRQPYLRPVTISADTITQMVPTDEQIRKGNSRVF